MRRRILNIFGFSALDWDQADQEKFDKFFKENPQARLVYGTCGISIENCKDGFAHKIIIWREANLKRIKII